MRSRLALACVTTGVPGVAAPKVLRRPGRSQVPEVLAAGQAEESRQAGQELKHEMSVS